MKIPYVDLGREAQRTLEPFLSDLPRFVSQGQFILGELVQAFERRFADRLGVEHAVGVNSGLDALFLALKACGVGPGDEVITAPNSFVATAAAIAHTGATVVFADVGKDRNIDPNDVLRRLTPRTKAIIPVHLTGRCADMQELTELSEQRGIALIEDCAQAIGSWYRGRPAGSIGRAGCFSFHPLKNLAALGDGGCIVTSDDELARQARLLRNHGLVDRNTTTMWGYNSRLDALQASWLLHRLDRLDEDIAQRRAHAQRYLTQLRDVPGIQLPSRTDDRVDTWHAFVIEVEERDALQAHLLTQGIQTLVHYPVPIHLQPAARGLDLGPGSFAVCERQASRILSLPVRESLTDAEVSEIIDAIRRFKHVDPLR